MSNYTRFIVMIATSTLVMFGLMYLNTYALDHVYFSETRTWMALYMGAAMAIVMLLFMLGMYQDRRKNALILGGEHRTVFETVMRQRREDGGGTTDARPAGEKSRPTSAGLGVAGSTWGGASGGPGGGRGLSGVSQSIGGLHGRGHRSHSRSHRGIASGDRGETGRGDARWSEW